MSARVWGIILFVAAAAIAGGYALLGGKDEFGKTIAQITGRPAENIHVLMYAGGEKISFLEDQEVRAIFRRKYGITYEARKAGSVEMVTERAILDQKPDLVWPGSLPIKALAQKNGLRITSDQIIFNAPIVIYSWASIADAFVAKGLAEKIGNEGLAYRIDTKRLLQALEQQTPWSEFGLERYGAINAVATDPRQSNSGNQFAGLIWQLYVDQGTPDPAGKTAEIFRRMGYLPSSSADLFRSYLSEGLARPLVAGYESQLIEFAHANPQQMARLRTLRPVILYPEPTVVSQHIALALTDNGRKMVEAMADPELATIAWQRFGFRSGLLQTIDADAAPVKGLPDNLGSFVPSPSVEQLEALMARIGQPASTPMPGGTRPLGLPAPSERPMSPLSVPTQQPQVQPGRR